jgi:hypothetical protein
MANSRPTYDEVLDTALGNALGLVQPSPFPETGLYHDTSAEGSRSIISSNSLRFSDPLFLNDGSEIFYANDLLAKAVADFVVTLPNSQRLFAARLNRMVAQTAADFRPLIFCMSALRDLSNQWRDYGRDVVPYCFELDVNGIRQADWSFQVDLVQMIYEEKDQRLVLMSLFEQIHDMLEANSELLRHKATRNTVMDDIVSLVWAALVRFKNPAYDVEQERRLLAHVANITGQKVEFRTSTLGIVPYLARTPRAGTRLPVNAVWVGPSPWGAYSRIALNRFLAENGYDYPTFYSEIPAR